MKSGFTDDPEISCWRLILWLQGTIIKSIGGAYMRLIKKLTNLFHKHYWAEYGSEEYIYFECLTCHDIDGPYERIGDGDEIIYKSKGFVYLISHDYSEDLGAKQWT